MPEKKEKDQWREVDEKDAKYIIILHAGGSECSTLFYESLEDALWAIKNSWFDPKNIFLTQVINWGVSVKETL